MFSVTLEQLREYSACTIGYNTVVCGLQGEKYEYHHNHNYMKYDYTKPIPLTDILKYGELEDVIWALRCIKNKEKEIRLFTISVARLYQHFMEDVRSVNALDVAERFANGLATIDELKIACCESYDANVDGMNYDGMNSATSIANYAVYTHDAECGYQSVALAYVINYAKMLDESLMPQIENLLIKMCESD